MKNKIIVPTILFIIVLAVSFFILRAEKNKYSAQATNNAQLSSSRPAKESQLIFFYGDGCPHCAKVEEYFRQNQVEEKIKFSQKEVYHNKNNADELRQKAKSCGLPLDSIGVPFLWTGDRCLIGDRDIINFFKQKVK